MALLGFKVQVTTTCQRVLLLPPGIQLRRLLRVSASVLREVGLSIFWLGGDEQVAQWCLESLNCHLAGH